MLLLLQSQAAVVVVVVVVAVAVDVAAAAVAVVVLVVLTLTPHHERQVTRQAPVTLEWNKASEIYVTNQSATRMCHYKSPTAC